MDDTAFKHKYRNIQSIIYRMLQIRKAKYDPRDAITIVDLIEIGSLLDEMKKHNETCKDLTVLSTCIQRAREIHEKHPSEIKKEDLVASQEINSLRRNMKSLLGIIDADQKISKNMN